MAETSKREADAYDRVIEAASELFDLIELSGIEIAEHELEELTIYLAQHASKVKALLKPMLKVRTRDR
jgi:uncharacterized protein